MVGHDRGPLPAFGIPFGPGGVPGLDFGALGGFGRGAITITAIDGRYFPMAGTAVSAGMAAR